MVRILHFVSKMDRAGQETFIMNIFRFADRDKYEFLFLCNKTEVGDYDAEITELGGHIYYLPIIKYKNGLDKYKQQINNLYKWLKDNKEKYDIVHLHTYHALDVWVHLEACRRAGVDRIVVHSHNSSGQHPLIHKIMRNTFRFYRFQKLACSLDAAKWMYGKKAVDCNEVRIILNGINTEAFKYSEDHRKTVRDKLGIYNKRVLGHIGRFNAQKNHKFLISSFYEYSKLDEDAVLLLIGKGELEQDIIDQIHNLGLEEKVMLLGTRDDILELLSAMDLFVFPSLYEGLSVVLIEAQCNGLTILCTDNLSPETVISKGMHLLAVDSPSLWSKSIKENIGVRVEVDDSEIKHVDVHNTSKELLALYEKMMI